MAWQGLRCCFQIKNIVMESVIEQKEVSDDSGYHEKAAEVVKKCFENIVKTFGGFNCKRYQRYHHDKNYQTFHTNIIGHINYQFKVKYGW
ncbi:hypothetical protein [Deferribacter abyssi]|uniref:hypothetical protein n=1 Tax=Deferribacter abyssi TaxID=213806 RepID=UPI003C1A7728